MTKRPSKSLHDALRILWYTLRGGQDDAIRELGELHDLLEPLRHLNADIPQRIRDASLLEAACVPSDDIGIIAKTWATGRLTAETVHQLRDRGIDVAPAIDWVRRAIDREILLDRLMDALSLKDMDADAGEESVDVAQIPAVIDRHREVLVQYFVRGPLGHRILPPGETWDAHEAPFRSRTVTRVSEVWQGMWPQGETVFSNNMARTRVRMPDEYGPWQEVSDG